MDEAVLHRMRARARDARTRATVQRWHYRQRHLASGVWFRLRRVLADAEAAYAISDEDARRLVVEGYAPEVCGGHVTPEKVIVFVDRRRVATVESRRPIPVGLGPDFLSARAVALVAFDGARR